MWSGEKKPNFEVSQHKLEAFNQVICRYWPDVEKARLVPGFGGVRTKISGPGAPAGDFVISGPADQGVDGTLNLFGVESPGLISALSPAQAVATMSGK
jgi:L-2-hydroxyglutarate oxidase LhgO